MLVCLPAETEPTLSMPEVSKRCGELWKDLSEEEKKPYHVSVMISGGHAAWFAAHHVCIWHLCG